MNKLQQAESYLDVFIYNKINWHVSSSVMKIVSLDAWQLILHGKWLIYILWRTIHAFIVIQNLTLTLELKQIAFHGDSELFFLMLQMLRAGIQESGTHAQHDFPVLCKLMAEFCHLYG